MQRTTIFIIIATIVVLGIGVTSLLIGRSDHSLASVTLKPTAYADNIGTADPENTFRIVMDGTTLVSGPTRISVKQGANVRVDIIAQGDESKLSLEGYDIVTESNAAAPGAFSFIASTPGTFRFYAIPEDDSSNNQPILLGSITVSQ